MRILRLIILLVFFGIQTGCGGVSGALVGNKKTNNSDEFLIKKKNPLVLPPDFETIPKPKKTLETDMIEDDDDEVVQKILGKKSKEIDIKSESTTGSSIEESILKKINVE